LLSSSTSSYSVMVRLPVSASSITPFLLPNLQQAHKGSSGKILVIGGSDTYVGAPLFSSQAALRYGSDLVTVFTPSQSCGKALKHLDPDLMVLPNLEALRTMGAKAFSAVVIGPGLGRDSEVHQELIGSNLFKPEELGRKTYIFDADSLFPFPTTAPLFDSLLTPNQLSSAAILTPNEMEMRRLMQVYCSNSDITSIPMPPYNNDDVPDFKHDNTDFKQHQVERCLQLINTIGCKAIILKGPIDVICVREEGEPPTTEGGGAAVSFDILICDTAGSMKRCGGIGDILSGCVGTTAGWYSSSNTRDSKAPRLGDALYFACHITRRAAHGAWKKKGRAMGAKDVLEEVGPSFAEVLDEHC
jgi:ATP-dependent NAD(P)H-hydrate dehydratase